MKTLGRKSFASFLSAVLNVARWVLVGLIAITVLVALPAYLVDSMVDLSWVSAPPPGVVLWPGMLLFLFGLLAALVVVVRLRRIFATLTEGDPFVPQNAANLQVIWLTLAGYELARMLVSALAAFAMNLSGQQPAQAGLHFALHINGGLWLAVAVLIVLAEIFREGTRLRDEQKLTI